MCSYNLQLIVGLLLLSGGTLVEKTGSAAPTTPPVNAVPAVSEPVGLGLASPSPPAVPSPLAD